MADMRKQQMSCPPMMDSAIELARLRFGTCCRELASTCDGQPICYTRVAAAPLSSRSARRDAYVTTMHTNSDSVSPVVTAPAWQESPAVEVDDTWLSSSDQDRSIRHNLRVIIYDELWHYRGLMYELTRRDIRVRYKQTVLGFAWAMRLRWLCG